MKEKAGSETLTIRPKINLRYRLNHTFKLVDTLAQQNLMGIPVGN
jgi:hypothetical protein